MWGNSLGELGKIHAMKFMFFTFYVGMYGVYLFILSSSPFLPMATWFSLSLRLFLSQSYTLTFYLNTSSSLFPIFLNHIIINFSFALFLLNFYVTQWISAILKIRRKRTQFNFRRVQTFSSQCYFHRVQTFSSQCNYHRVQTFSSQPGFLSMLPLSLANKKMKML